MLELVNVSKEFVGTSRRVKALSEINLTIADGRFVALVGPSGCGKTTLLNLIMGLVPHSSGQIRFDGHPSNGNGHSRPHALPAILGYITQRDTLLPWRTLVENVELGMEVRGQFSPRERRRRAEELIELVGLHGFEHEYPCHLSGGMRQRAQLIRTLAYDPQVILLDEPFGSLDAITRGHLQSMLLQLWQDRHKTILFVTHDLAEAITLADEVIVMSAAPGKIKTVRPIPLSRPRSVFELHAQPGFGLIYRELWNELVVELQVKTDASTRN